MSSQFRLVATTRHTGHRRNQRGLLLIVIALAVQGCAVTPPRPLVGPDAADPAVRIPTAVYRSAIGGFDNARPSEPTLWRGPDHAATPQPKKDEP
jgi:hypothetical protein